MGFKENLKNELNYSGMLVRDLARLSGVNKRTLDSYLSNNDNIPSAENAVKIAKVLGTTVEFLVTGDEKKGAEEEMITNILASLNKHNKKMTLAIIQAIQKQERLEKE